jgi:hypothetical protein
MTRCNEAITGQAGIHTRQNVAKRRSVRMLLIQPNGMAYNPGLAKSGIGPADTLHLTTPQRFAASAQADTVKSSRNHHG